jgi:hypothetical protein
VGAVGCEAQLRRWVLDAAYHRLREELQSDPAEWHTEPDGTRWRFYLDGSYTVILPGKIDYIQTTVKVKP